MRKKSSVSAALAVVFLSVMLIGTPVDAAKNGAKCKKAGATEMTKGITYICTKSGKTLKWVKATATTTTASTTTTLATVVSKTCAAGGTCKVGDTGPGGGIVFYVDTVNIYPAFTYLEVATNTWNGGSQDPQIIWCDNTRTLIGGTSTRVGTGSANTTLMLERCTTGAAVLARAYAGGGKSDWFLPSKDELNLMYANRATIGGFVVDIGEYYWSSSEYDASTAWYQHLSGGAQDYYEDYNQNLSHRVRPVRAFG